MQGINIKEKPKSIIPSLLGGTVSLTVSTLIVKLLGLIYKIPLASILGDEGMGYFNSAYTVFAFFYLLCTAGVPKAVMILVSEAKERNGGISSYGIVRVASVMFLLLGVITCGIFIIFSAPLARLIGNSGSAFTMIAIAPSIIFVALAGVIRGYLSANMMLLDIAVSQVIEGVGKLALGLVLATVGVRLNMPLTMLSAMTILGVTLGSLFGLIYLFICSKIKIKNENTGQKHQNGNFAEICKRILSISIPITLSAAIMSITNLIDLGLIMRSLAEIGYSEGRASALYGNYTTLAVPMLNLALSIITPISVAHLPLLTRGFVSRDREAIIDAEKSAIELTALVSAPMMIGMILFSREILGLLFPKSEIELGGALLCLLAPAILFSSLLMIVNTVLESCGKVKAPLISMLAGSIIKLIVSYILITRSDFGIFGAPIGTVISYATALLISLILYGRVSGRHIPLVSRMAAAYLVAFIAVFASRFVYDRLYFIINERILLLGCIFLAALIYLGLLVFFGMLSPKKIEKMAKYTKSVR